MSKLGFVTVEKRKMCKIFEKGSSLFKNAFVDEKTRYFLRQKRNGSGPCLHGTQVKWGPRNITGRPGVSIM